MGYRKTVESENKPKFQGSAQQNTQMFSYFQILSTHEKGVKIQNVLRTVEWVNLGSPGRRGSEFGWARRMSCRLE